ncbi:MAG TPA: hypothetical protein VFX70_00200, partial [Mycobacteriales bacterium]|nr:hypothetical protein [Mycobacteriales bacterium]
MSELVAALGEGVPSWLTGGTAGWDVTATGDRGARIACGGAFPLDLPGVLGHWPADVAASVATVDDLADRLTGHRPPQVVRHFPAFVPLLAAGGLVRAVHPDDAWLLATRLTEACRVVLMRVTAGGDLPAARLLPLVRRARFLLLSAPGRYRPRPFPTGRVFGSARLLVDRAHEAREEWALDLLNHDQHPVLRRWPAEQLDRDLRRLVLVHDTAAAGELLPPPPVAPAITELADPDDAVAWVVREGFLP